MSSLLRAESARDKIKNLAYNSMRWYNAQFFSQACARYKFRIFGSVICKPLQQRIFSPRSTVRGSKWQKKKNSSVPTTSTRSYRQRWTGIDTPLWKLIFPEHPRRFSSTRSTLSSWITPTLNRATHARTSLIVRGNIRDYQADEPSSRITPTTEIYRPYFHSTTLAKGIKRPFRPCFPLSLRLFLDLSCLYSAYCPIPNRSLDLVFFRYLCWFFIRLMGKKGFALLFFCKIDRFYVPSLFVYVKRCFRLKKRFMGSVWMIVWFL